VQLFFCFEVNLDVSLLASFGAENLDYAAVVLHVFPNIHDPDVDVVQKNDSVSLGLVAG